MTSLGRLVRSGAPFLILLVWPCVLAHAATPHPLVAHVNRVSDGDTVIATTNEGTKLGIRLLGIDAPEVANGAKPGQPYGDEARDCRAGTAWHDCGD